MVDLTKMSSNFARSSETLDSRQCASGWNHVRSLSLDSIPIRTSSLIKQDQAQDHQEACTLPASANDTPSSPSCSKSEPESSPPAQPFSLQVCPTRPKRQAKRRLSYTAISISAYSDHERFFGSSRAQALPHQTSREIKPILSSKPKSKPKPLQFRTNLGSPSYRRNNRSLLLSVKPMPPVKERVSTSEVDEAFSSCSDLQSDVEMRAKVPMPHRQKHDVLSIDLPLIQRGQRETPPVVENRLVDPIESITDGNNLTFQDENDDSSWPSTPSTTPLEFYFAQDTSSKDPSSQTRSENMQTFSLPISKPSAKDWTQYRTPLILHKDVGKEAHTKMDSRPQPRRGSFDQGCFSQLQAQSSVDLEPILKNSLAMQSLPSFQSFLPSPQNRDPSSVCSPSTPSSARYKPTHAKKGSEHSFFSSASSLTGPASVSMDLPEGQWTPGSIPSTTITVPSPRSDNSVNLHKKSIQPILVMRRNRFSASTPCLHPARTSSNHQATQNNLLQDYIEKQKGRVTKDSESIAEWITTTSQTEALHEGEACNMNPLSNKEMLSSEGVGRRKLWISKRIFGLV